MTLELLLSFSAVALLSIVSPGPAVLLAIRNGLTGRPTVVFCGAAGNALGIFLLSSASMVGVNAILHTSATLFFIAKAAGAAYLIYLGIRHFGNRSLIEPHPADGHIDRSHKQYFQEAFLLAVTNPKPILFFGALFPQFLVPGEPLFIQFAVLTAIFMALSLMTLHCYALLAHRARRLLLRQTIARWINRVVGSVFIGFGIALLTLRRQPA